MLIVLMVFGAAAIALLPLARPLGARVFWVAALVPLGAFVHTLLQAPAVLSQDAARVPVERLTWIAQLDLTLDVRMDTLSWVLALVVTGVGSLVLLYCAGYFRDDEPGLGRFAAVLLAFAGAMYGLVIADDVYLLFVLWEATSVFSYLLIGHYTHRRASRGAALQALVTTTLGGLVMLVGLVLLAVQAGTSSLTAILAELPAGPLTTTAIMLVLVGALSKSAIVPLHFWLPGAMAAPTPVSAYLHAAAMVKAGIYLILRLAPAGVDVPGWREVLIVLGLVTLLLGGWAALKQTDLKLLLAYGTVSQLGLLVVVAGFGTRDTALAALALLLAHALFKSALFLVVGIIDHEAGTRDLRKLSGLGRRSPWLAAIAAVVLASMAGLPPVFGFVAKETVLYALLAAATGQTGEAPLDPAAQVWAAVALVGVVVGSVLTVAYSIRFFWGAFARKQGVDDVTALAVVSRRFLLAPAVLAVASLLLGPLAGVVDAGLAGYPALFPYPGEVAYHLALWHGLTPELGLSALAIGLGALLFAARAPVARLQGRLASEYTASEAYWDAMGAVDRLAVRVTSLTQRGSLPFYLGVILVVFVAVTTAGLLLGDSWPSELRLWDHPAQLAIGVVMIIAAIAATQAQKRFAALVVVGVTGFGMSAIFALQGAPDLALTQILVEVVTLIAFVLVLRRLPARLGDKHGSSHRLLRAGIGIGVGLVMALVALIVAGSRIEQPISLAWPELAYEIGHGRNTVNVALVDLRGWDTMGELAVVIAAATGVASLLFLRSRGDSPPRLGRAAVKRRISARLDRVREQGEQGELRNAWILAGPSLDPRHRSILLEVVVRLTFHAIIVISLYLLFAGHNLPGGGFVGGLVAGLALVARYLAGGRYELGAALPVGAGAVLGTGLIIAAGTALVPVLLGAPPLTSTYWEGEVWLLGEIEFVTSTIFDIGVYLVVVGLVLDVLRSLGGEVDRQGGDELAPAGRSGAASGSLIMEPSAPAGGAR
ncbi:Na+/H+ antiporter subunit A [Microcella humidisoli]|uniref:Na+/H+ antiporter subunit A n=1 Tax=Microcella humidisoli TaxID=2963406 RepID=A0ABY5FUX7_9MICO|nr:Na+/H+ antiporter subunit A [Microcella humidisoli]UTT61700.1 Na+/H+ antiporter subunit A [Microcella humidisoli]